MAKAKKAATKKSTKKATPCKCKSLGYVYVNTQDGYVNETLYVSIPEAEQDWSVQDAISDGTEFAIAELKQVRYKTGRPSADEVILWDETCD